MVRIENHLPRRKLSRQRVRASVYAVALEQAPFLGDWGKTVADGLILTDSLLSRFNKLNVPLYLIPGYRLKAYSRPTSRASAQSQRQAFYVCLGLASRSGDPFVRLMLSGAFDKYPHLQVISGTGGRCYPSGSSVLMTAYHWLNGSVTHANENRPGTRLRYPAGMLTLPHFKFIYELMGAERSCSPSIIPIRPWMV